MKTHHFHLFYYLYPPPPPPPPPPRIHWGNVDHHVQFVFLAIHNSLSLYTTTSSILFHCTTQSFISRFHYTSLFFIRCFRCICLSSISRFYFTYHFYCTPLVHLIFFSFSVFVVCSYPSCSILIKAFKTSIHPSTHPSTRETSHINNQSIISKYLISRLRGLNYGGE